jgi:hypothetical protein
MEKISAAEGLGCVECYPFIPGDAKRGQEKLKVRLIIVQKTQEATAKARKTALRRGSKNSVKVDNRTLEAAGYMLLISSLDQDEFTADEIGHIYRLRWQVDIDQSWDLSRIRLREEGRICRWRQASPRRWRGADGPEGGDGLRVGVNQLDGPTAGGWNEAAG